MANSVSAAGLMKTSKGQLVPGRGLGEEVAFMLWTVEKLLEMWMGIQMFETLALSLRMIAMKLYFKSNCPPRFSLVP